MIKTSSETVWSTQILKGLGTDGVKSTYGESSPEKSWARSAMDEVTDVFSVQEAAY